MASETPHDISEILASDPDVVLRALSEARQDVLQPTSRWDCPWRSGRTEPSYGSPPRSWSGRGSLVRQRDGSCLSGRL